MSNVMHVSGNLKLFLGMKNLMSYISSNYGNSIEKSVMDSVLFFW